MQPRARTLALVATCGGAFLAFLDTTIVNTSFPDIRASFGDATPAELSWILDAYFIALAALLVPAGGIADRYGRRRVFVGGVTVFVATSLLCALAPSWELLVAARALQGLAAATMVSVSLALLLPLFPLERRAAGVGIWGAAAALAATVGPPLGGVLVEIADWRWIFLVNLPLGAVVLAATLRGVEESRDESASGLPDLAGSALAAAGLGVLALGIVEGNNWGWDSAAVLGSFAAGALLLAGVVHRSRAHPRPIVDLELFAIRSFRLGTLGTMLFAAAFFSVILGNILFLTGVWGYSVLDAGLAVIPGPLTSAILAGPAGKLADRFGHRAVIVPGTLVYGAGLAILMSAGTEPDYLATWLPGMLLAGAGIGLAFPTLGAAAAAEIPAARFGIATALTSAGRQLGAVLGTAILIAIVGEPATLAEAASVADDAYLFGIGAAVAAGAVALRLVPQRGKSGAPLSTRQSALPHAATAAEAKAR